MADNAIKCPAISSSENRFCCCIPYASLVPALNSTSNPHAHFTSPPPFSSQMMGILHVMDTHHSSREGYHSSKDTHPPRQGHPSFVEGGLPFGERQPSSTSRTPTIRRGRATIRRKRAILHVKDTHHSSREGRPPRPGYPPFVEGRSSSTTRMPTFHDQDTHPPRPKRDPKRQGSPSWTPQSPGILPEEADLRAPITSFGPEAR